MTYELTFERFQLRKKMEFKLFLWNDCALGKMIKLLSFLNTIVLLLAYYLLAGATILLADATVWIVTLSNKILISVNKILIGTCLTNISMARTRSWDFKCFN